MSRQKKDTALYLRQKIEAAQNFINAIAQRQDTMMRTMKAIVNLQRAFFEEGDSSLLQPMILEDVAKATGLDKSTISRVTKSKYVQTDFGIFPLKFFFNEKFTTSGGENLSKMQIKGKLREIIEAENKKKPLSDDDIADMLNQAGFPVARRTVAKYREKMNIPVARLRRQ
jgi:RNA polymerase sigma-54 factor